MSSHPFISFCRKTQINSVKRQMKGQPLPEGVEVFSDIHYMRDESPYHTLDVYLPKDAEGLMPIVVSIHGGAFIGGDKFYNKEFGMRLALQHICVVNINYDLAPDVRLTEMVRCVSNALMWVYREGANYHGDTERIYGLGDSAGGWQAITYTIVNQHPEVRDYYNFHIINPVKFKGLILICPVANVKAAMGKKSKIRWFKKAVYKTGKDENYQLTSIQDIIDLAPIPPSMIITTANDHYYYQSVELDELMTKYHIEHRMLDVKDISHKLDHCFNIMHPLYEESVAVNDKIADFVLRSK